MPSPLITVATYKELKALFPQLALDHRDSTTFLNGEPVQPFLDSQTLMMEYTDDEHWELSRITTVTLLRGPKATRHWTHKSPSEALKRAQILMELHDAPITIGKDDTIVVDASEYYDEPKSAKK